jgi:alpha-D-xyloside xylohydrolase
MLLPQLHVHRMGEREPCRWPDPARRVARDWIRLRYRLLPHVLAEAARAAARGLPFTRPLVLEFPDDPATWTDWWTRERVRGPRWVETTHGLDTMPLYLREGAVMPMGPDLRWVGEGPTDPLTVVVAPFDDAGRTELAVPVDGREVAIRLQAGDGRHRVQLDGHRGEVVLEAPAGVELRP